MIILSLLSPGAHQKARLGYYDEQFCLSVCVLADPCSSSTLVVVVVVVIIIIVIVMMHRKFELGTFMASPVL